MILLKLNKMHVVLVTLFLISKAFAELELAPCQEEIISNIKSLWEITGKPENVLQNLAKDGEYCAVHTSFNSLSLIQKYVLMDQSSNSSRVSLPAIHIETPDNESSLPTSMQLKRVCCTYYAGKRRCRSCAFPPPHVETQQLRERARKNPGNDSVLPSSMQLNRTCCTLYKGTLSCVDCLDSSSHLRTQQLKGSFPAEVQTFNLNKDSDGSLYDEHKNMCLYTVVQGQGLLVNYYCNATGGNPALPPQGSIYVSKKLGLSADDLTVRNLRESLEEWGILFTKKSNSKCFRK